MDTFRAKNVPIWSQGLDLPAAQVSAVLAEYLCDVNLLVLLILDHCKLFEKYILALFRQNYEICRPVKDICPTMK